MEKRVKSGSIALIIAVLALALSAGSTGAQQLGPGGSPGGHAMVLEECEVDGTEHVVDVGGRDLHGIVYGEGSPTVVLIAGFNAPQAYWNGIVPDLAGKATVVTYDRAGYGDSEIGDLPLDGGQSAKDLGVLLKEMGVPKPYIVVGHSYGAHVARLFASMHPSDIGGLVLEDGGHEDTLDEQLKALDGQDLEELEKMVAMMAEMAAPGTELAYRDATAEQLRESDPLPEVPFVVITAGDRSKGMPPVFTAEGQAKLEELGLKLQQRLAELIPGGVHVVADGVGHNIHVENPEVVLDPLIEMIELTQGGSE